MECPFRIRIAASSDGTKLVVKELIDTHNHETSQVSAPKRHRQILLCMFAIYDFGIR